MAHCSITQSENQQVACAEFVLVIDSKEASGSIGNIRFQLSFSFQRPNHNRSYPSATEARLMEEVAPWSIVIRPVVAREQVIQQVF